jgi:1-acyl-sn-glycerol-3-phosphate acyltransferase
MAGYASRRDFAIWDQGLLPLMRGLLRSGYFSLEVRGAASLGLRPQDSIVYAANHSGWFSVDTMMIAFTIHEWLGRDLVPHTFSEDSQLKMPVVGEAIARVGGIPVSLLKDPQRCPEWVRHVGIYPEGARGNSKPFWRAYRLERYRTGFVRFALLRNSRVVPIAVIGGEECAPVAWRMPLNLLTRRHVSVPLSVLPLPTRWKVVFLEPIVFAYRPEEANDAALCADLAASVRERTQAAIDAETTDRRLARLSRWLGSPSTSDGRQG